MALLNIEYGSIASSDTMNKNFSYLDNRISDSNTQINSSIASILSNIATINSRLDEISEGITSSVSSLQSTIADNKNKTKLLVLNSGMVPNWSACRSVTLDSETDFTASSNGYILALPDPSGKGEIFVNGSEISVKTRVSAYDNAAILIPIPVKSGDVVSTNVVCQAVYFVPSAEISVENF